MSSPEEDCKCEFCELDRLREERDRLLRFRAVECGDEDPPEGWTRDTTDVRWTRFSHESGAEVFPWGVASWKWVVSSEVFGWGKSALEAMEAATENRGDT